MDRFPARLRTNGHEGHLTYDLFHVWRHDEVQMGVRYGSRIFVYLEEPSDEPAEIAVFLPGQPTPRRARLKWPDEFNAEPREFGIASVVSLDDVPLVVFHELSVGKP